jgi:hypothetical protein
MSGESDKDEDSPTFAVSFGEWMSMRRESSERWELQRLDELCQPLWPLWGILSISKVDNKRMLSDFAKILEINAKIADPPPDSLIRAAKHSIARVLLATDYNTGYLPRPPEFVCDDECEFFQHLEAEVAHGSRPLNRVLRHKETSSHTVFTLKYAVHGLLVDGHLGGTFFYKLHARSRDYSWMLGTGLSRVIREQMNFATVVPLISVNPSLKMWFITGGREAGARDHLWLDWNLNKGLGPVAILDRWDKMPDEERHQISPALPGKVGGDSKQKGIYVVKEGLKKAKSEVKKAGMAFYPEQSGNE